MCGGYGFFAPKNFQSRSYISTIEARLELRYNVRPGQFMPIVTRNSPNKAIAANWGLVPSWSPEPKVKSATINVHAEGVAASRVYAKPL